MKVVHIGRNQHTLCGYAIVSLPLVHKWIGESDLKAGFTPPDDLCPVCRVYMAIGTAEHFAPLPQRNINVTHLAIDDATKTQIRSGITVSESTDGVTSTIVIRIRIPDEVMQNLPPSARAALFGPGTPVDKLERLAALIRQKDSGKRECRHRNATSRKDLAAAAYVIECPDCGERRIVDKDKIDADRNPWEPFG